MLDAGAYGVICPMVNTGPEAEALVSATHYQPRGTRSYGPMRGFFTAARSICSTPTIRSSSSP